MLIYDKNSFLVGAQDTFTLMLIDLGAWNLSVIKSEIFCLDFIMG